MSVIKNLTINDEKLRDLHLRKLALGEIQGPPTGKASVDKVWLRYYGESAILSDISDKSIYNFMKHSNENNDFAVAINYFGKKITYGQLFDKIDRVAKSFLNIGVRFGDKVTLSLANTPENTICLYALNKIGAIANMIDLRLKGDKLVDAINSVDSKTIITTDLFVNNLEEIVEKTNLKNIVVASPGESLPLAIKPLYKVQSKVPTYGFKLKYETWKNFYKRGINNSDYVYESNSNDPVCVLHTSGTTGSPKSVVLTNKNFNAMVCQYTHSGLVFAKGDRFLSQVPTFLAYSSLMAIHLPLSLGMTLIMLADYQPEKFANNIMRYRINHAVAGPADWCNFLDNKKARKKDFSYLSTAASGSDKIINEKKNAVNDLLLKGGAKNKIIEGYGMTEASSAVITNLPQINIENSVGIPLSKMNICIYDNDNEKELSYGEVGEICFSGPTVMKEYYNNLDETNNVLRVHSDGKVWLHTGDLGCVDLDGLLYLKGRIKRVIVRHDGIKISPYDIEKIINSLDCVNECCVVGTDDKENGSGEVPAANIVFVGNSVYSDEELLEFVENACKSQLGTKYLPKYYRKCDALPLTSVGKVDYRKLELECRKNNEDKVFRK